MNVQLPRLLYFHISRPQPVKKALTLLKPLQTIKLLQELTFPKGIETKGSVER